MGEGEVRESYGLMIFDNPNQRKLGCPPQWLLLNRLQWGLNAVLAKLDATAPWPDHFGRSARAPFVGAPPAGERRASERRGGRRHEPQVP